MEKNFDKTGSKKKKLIKKLILVPVILLSGLFLVMIVFSPYGKEAGYDYKVIKTEIVINAPADSIFRYLGNSDNAAEWSVFVAKIVPLNAGLVPDGKAGCRRRCYGRQDKRMQWDELTTIVEKNKRRQLTIYSMKNFPMSASGLATEQRYFPIGKDRTRLVFTVFYLEKPTAWETFKTYLAAYKVKSVFEQNLLNIKLACEGKQPVIE